MIRILSTLFLVILLTACGAPKIPVPDPTPLTDFEESVALNSAWKSTEVRVTSDASRAFLSLRPTFAAESIFAASPDGTVVSIDAGSGSVAWKTELDTNIVAGVGAGDGIAVVVSESGTVYALSFTDGSILWEYKLTELVFAPPLVYRDVVVLRTIDGNLFALSASDGNFLWDAIYDQPEFLEFGSAAPIGYQNTAIIGNAMGRVIATELASGFDIWQIYLGSERSTGSLRSRESRPILYRNTLFLSDLSRAIVAYDLNTSGVIWEDRRPSGRNLEVSASNVFGHNTDSLVFALQRTDGELDWQQNALLHRGIDDMALVDEWLVVSDGLGYFHVLDGDSGEIIGRYRGEERVAKDGLITDGNHLFIYYRSGRIEALSLQSVKQ